MICKKLNGINKFLWLLPFISFLFGYQLLKKLTYKATIVTPCVVGLTVTDAIKVLSNNQLNGRILSEVEDDDLPEGIIISQSPYSGQLVKSQQSVFLKVIRHKPKPQIPSFYNINIDKAKTKIKELGIQAKAYSVESSLPVGNVIGQVMPIKALNEPNQLLIYTSKGLTNFRVFPNLKHYAISEIQNFIQAYNIDLRIKHLDYVDENHICSDKCIVKLQRPVAGLILDITRPISLQLSVTKI